MIYDRESVKSFLVVWEQLLETGRIASNKKQKDPNKRIHRTTGSPIIFDRSSWKEQINIQKSLTHLMPEYKDLINSEPALNGYEWKTSDYIELFFDHYELVIYKLKEKLCCV